MSNNKDPEIRYCKKCGCELVSTNKHKLCDNCRRERNANVRKGVLGAVGTVGSVALFIVTKGKHGGGGIKPELGRVDGITDLFPQSEVLKRSANLCVCIL